METRYTVRQAVEMTGVKSYVLRYWEEELELQIHRNELGHRYYTGYDIQLFLNIKELKKRGLQLRAIKNLIPQITASMTGFGESASTLLEGEVIDHAEVKTDRDLKEKISQKAGNSISEFRFRFWLPIPELSKNTSIPPTLSINSANFSGASGLVTSI